MITVMSLWRNDEERHLQDRVVHLLSKRSFLDVRWLWVVGDSTDGTERFLRDVASLNPAITVIRHDSGMPDSGNVVERRRRSAWTASRMFEEIPLDAEYVCLHESDLRSPDDVLDRLLTVSANEPVAAWPVINLNGTPQFYDIWAFRFLNGTQFSPFMTRPKRPFEVGSFGSCWIAPADFVRGRQLDETAIVGLCQRWRMEGIRMWADPRTIVEQPTSLWVCS